MMMKIKLNPAYKKAHKTKARYRILYGGAGSGKSHFTAQETLLNMLSSPHYSYLVVRKTSKSIRNSVFRLLTQMISDANLEQYFKVNKTEMTITCATGSSLITSGLDDVEKLKSVANINRIWIEEASEVSESDFNQLDLRLRGQSKVGYQMTATFNPISETHWLKRSFFDIGRPDSFVLKTTYKDNKFLDDKYISTLLELEKQDYQYFRIYALGEWGSIGNIIYSNWEKADLSADKQYFDNTFNGLDFGFADDPTAFVRVHLDNKHKTIYIFDEFALRGLYIDDVAKELRDRIGNEYITCDSSEPRSIQDLKRNDIRALAAKKGPGSIEHGIKWLQGHKIIVDNSCIETIKELSTYKYKEDKDGNVIAKPVDQNNHILDAIRYALESEMVQNKPTMKLFKHGL
jgi:phage terminase large subunit